MVLYFSLCAKISFKRGFQLKTFSSFLQNISLHNSCNKWCITQQSELVGVLLKTSILYINQLKVGSLSTFHNQSQIRKKLEFLIQIFKSELRK